MKRIFTLLLFVLAFTANVSAQFTDADVRFWVGEGPDTAYMVIDFRDDTADPSYVWGFHYDATAGDLTFRDMMEAIDVGEPKFDAAISDLGFLENIIYNSHDSSNKNDWWSTWSGYSADEMYMNSGLPELLENGKWYGASFGWTPEPLMPTTHYAAYSSLWFSPQDVDYWVGAGENESVIVIDFNMSNEVVTYAWGIKYDGTIDVQTALEAIDAADTGLAITITNGHIGQITYAGMNGIVDANNDWHSFTGTNMSDWLPNNDLSTELTDGDWFGATLGNTDARRPFIPTAAQEPVAGVKNNAKMAFTVYPNPVASVLTIKADAAVQSITVVNVAGQVVKTASATNTADLSNLTAGVYFVQVATENGASTQKIIKR